MEQQVKYSDTEINAYILKAVREMGFEYMTPIQEQAIPVLLEGKDVIGQAQTGTGKTAAFSIPMIQKIDISCKKPQGIILCPTRELAMQAAEEIRKITKYMHGLKVLPVYGGQDISKQIRALSQGVQIIVGTPGRVMDHLRRHTIKTANVQMIVLDEADEMLNMGFREDMETILSQMPEEHQMALFSATMPQAILEITNQYQKDAVFIKVTPKEVTVAAIEQSYYRIARKDKMNALCRLIDFHQPRRSLIFCNTKKMVDEMTQELKGRGYEAEGLHGDLSQFQRDTVMNLFRSGRCAILIATDVAARGIDVSGVDAVFNYDVPEDIEYYVHRIGRTGRAGREGRAFSLAVGSEVYKLRDIQRFCKTKIVPQPIPSLDDVTAIKAEKILDDVQQHIGEDSNLERMTDIIEKRLLAEDYTSLELAAAFLKMAMGDDYEDIADEGRPLRDLDDLDRRGGRNDRGRNGRRRQRGDDEEYMDRKNARGGMTRLFINLGKNQNVKPGDILGAIAGESGIPGRLVGSIDMYDKYTFVEVPKEQADIVMDAMNHVKIKGKSVHVEKANRR